MNPGPKTLCATLGVVLLAGRSPDAVAMAALERHEPSWDAPGVWQLAPSASPARTRQLVHSAACDLQQAALQSDFASNERVLSLLQSAQDELARAITGPLWRDRWQQVDRLVSDIERTIELESAQLGPAASPDGDSVGPPAPSRATLAVLAGEGRALAQRAPAPSVAKVADSPLVYRSDCTDRH